MQLPAAELAPDERQSAKADLRVVEGGAGQLQLMYLPVDSLVMGDDFRLDDDPEDLKELADSIAERGVLQPLLVRPKRKGWEVVAGRRRLSASRVAGLEVVPCLLKQFDDDEASDAALVENLHRRQLSPIEEALAYAKMRDREGLTQTQIAKRVGRSQPHVSTLLRLLLLPQKIRTAVHEGKMSYATALRPKNRTGQRQGSSATALHSDEVTIISHWRRRHDRLMAGLHALRKAVPADVDEYREMVKRVIRLDAEPLEEQVQEKDWRDDWRGQRNTRAH